MKAIALLIIGLVLAGALGNLVSASSYYGSSYGSSGSYGYDRYNSYGSYGSNSYDSYGSSYGYDSYGSSRGYGYDDSSYRSSGSYGRNSYSSYDDSYNGFHNGVLGQRDFFQKDFRKKVFVTRVKFFFADLFTKRYY